MTMSFAQLRRASSIMGPQVDVVAVDIGSPGDDVARVAEVLGVGAELASINGDERVAAGGGADGAVELRGSRDD